MKKLNKKWFELEDLRKRFFSKSVWIPIYGSKEIYKKHNYPEVGYVDEVLIIGSAVIFHENREEVEELNWDSFCDTNSTAYLNSNNDYFESNAFTGWSEKKLGFRLVLSQFLNSDHPQNVEIYQDFIYAYGLVQEGDKWLKPHAGYEEVIRVQRDERGVITFVEVRAEYLRDYLAARKAALRLYYYRCREAVLQSDPEFGWPENGSIVNEEHNQCKVRSYRIDETGDFPDNSYAIFSIRRTDVDPEIDIPEFPPENEQNTAGETRRFIRKANDIRYRVQGELWRGEWIEPAQKSERLGFGEAEERFSVFSDASGTKEDLEGIRDEDSIKYLWFNPSLVGDLLACRGTSLKWYTAETGSLEGEPSDGVHFGVNQLGLINALACDVASLPVWQRRIWAARNTRPDGGVCEELLMAQMKCTPADTKAPEFLVKEAVNWLKQCCEEKYKEVIFREHNEVKSLERQLHRFVALDESGLRRLSKDIVKFTIERLEKESLRRILGVKDSIGTLKLLEKLLASVTSDDFAKLHMAPLFGVYDLRGADSHLASGNIECSYKRIGIDREKPYVVQGAMLLKNVANTIGEIGIYIKKSS